MAIETVPAASQGADTLAVPRQLLENIRRAFGATIDRQVVVDDLCSIGIKSEAADCMVSLLTAIKASQGDDAEGLTELVPEIDALLEVQHGCR